MGAETNGRLAGKRALITGGAGGIGRKVAEMMAREGAGVALSDINGEGADAAAAEIAAETGCTALGLQHDVTDLAAWQRAVGAADEALGGLNVLVNNAGICIPGSVENLDIADWDLTMDVDLKSVFLGCRVSLPVLAKSAPGSIINISSIAGLIASYNFAAYN
ncbi:MAG: SDR family NAD(P)-dependent oxidoreductase, partial [Rhizobiales bacterium]|nr:SDR family NAD(P)-dependent oxidoreductase [Hyphomicrobiales bacterium]